MENDEFINEEQNSFKSKIKRINIVGVPVDICKNEDMDDVILEILAKPGPKQIVFLSIWDLLKGRNQKKSFSQYLKTADLILPISVSLIKGARFLKKDIPVRYNPFKAVITILSSMENHYKSLFLLGGRKKSLQLAERNVRETFPELQIVGRYVGYHSKKVEEDIVQAIYKSSPSLVIVSEGIKEKNLWAYNHRNEFSSSIFLYYRDCIGIFSERLKRVKETTFDKGLEIWSEILRNPLKLFLFFPFIRYIILLVWYRLFKKNS
ncbi:WecB/TagA/CpsF family glycosyltransferase [Treponema pectinovorum]|uniref:WecB/TagA/CpsF family glycosyltransferase n=1 Tax=Treponema pectinovorum TaxID=164 RepID=UPI0011C9612F|nr:WecB/TagA/CpsF family glycosyltransferase [Treponema pectinovorum]